MVNTEKQSSNNQNETPLTISDSFNGTDLQSNVPDHKLPFTVAQENNDIQTITDYVNTLKKYRTTLKQVKRNFSLSSKYAPTYDVVNPNYDEELKLYNRVGGLSKKPTKVLKKPFTPEMATAQLENIDKQIKMGEIFQANTYNRISNINQEIKQYKREHSFLGKTVDGTKRMALTGIGVGKSQLANAYVRSNELTKSALQKANFTNINHVAQSLIDSQAQNDLGQVHGLQADSSAIDLSR